MPKTKSPRKGSLQFWPRKRANSESTRVRHFTKISDPKIVGFAGYKVGMIQASYTESRKNRPAKGMEVVMPVTVLECPPLRVYSIRFYSFDENKNLIVSKEIVSDNIDKVMKRKVSLSKKNNIEQLNNIKIDDFEEVRILVYTQPKLCGFGKKKPELFELGIGGKIQDQFEYAKSTLGKEIFVSDIFKNNDLVDVRGVTKGKGTQGPVKRFGISLRHHKSEKTKRGPGSLGPWNERGKHTWTVAHAGQMGYHQRTGYNKVVLKVLKSQEAQDLNRNGGLHKYGDIKNDVLLLKGSILGARKRLVKMIFGQRPNKKLLLPPNTNVNIIKNY